MERTFSTRILFRALLFSIARDIRAAFRKRRHEPTRTEFWRYYSSEPVL